MHHEAQIVLPEILRKARIRRPVLLGHSDVHGKTPYTYQILFRRHTRPVIERVSTLKSSKQTPIGWHTLRRSLATLLISNGENVKVAQSQLRHTTPKITLELYAQAVSTEQQKAHRKVIQMVLPANFSEKLKA
jgi:integrase